MNITIRAEGFDEIVRNINRLEVNKEFVDAANRSVAEVQKRAMVEVPVKTGQLQKSHTLSPATLHTAKAEVYTDKEYAVPVHEGHRLVAWGHNTGRRIKANPWMKRAAEKSEKKINSIFSKAGDRVARILTR